MNENSPLAGDWRNQGQEKYLKGKVVSFKKYLPLDLRWNHDHCEFCGNKFSLKEGDLNEGYTTGNGYLWICCTCYHDFKSEFEWIEETANNEDDNELSF